MSEELKEALKTPLDRISRRSSAGGSASQDRPPPSRSASSGASTSGNESAVNKHKGIDSKNGVVKMF